MASFWKVSQVSSSGTVRYWDLAETMLAAGWTMPNAGDGTTMGPNQITHGGSGTGGLDNSRAWMRLRAPDSSYELTFQRTITYYTWRLKYATTAFTLGSPDATTTPSASNELIVKGSGTDASPSGINIHATNSCVHHCMASDIAPFSFYIAAYPSGGGTCNHFVAVDEVAPSSPSDLVKTVAMFGNTLPSLSLGTAGGEGGMMVTQLGSSIAIVRALMVAGYEAAKIGSNPLTLQDDLMPIFPGRYAPDGAPYGYKGYTKTFVLAPNVRASGDTYSLSGTRSHICLSGGSGPCYVVPFNGSLPLV